MTATPNRRENGRRMLASFPLQPLFVMILSCFLFFFSSLSVLPTVKAIAVEDWVFAPNFAIGQFNFFESGKVYPLRESLRLCLQLTSGREGDPEIERENDEFSHRLMNYFIDSQGKSLVDIFNVINSTTTSFIGVAGSRENDQSLSIRFSTCTLPGRLDSLMTYFHQVFSTQYPDVKHHQINEWFNHLSLLLYPDNYASAKNLAFAYECSGYFHSSRSLYKECYLTSRDPGCYIHSISSSPILPYSEGKTEMVYLDILRTAFHLLLEKYQNKLILPGARDSASSAITVNLQDESYDIAYNLLREVAINTHYLGYSPGRIFELISQSALAFYPDLSMALIPPKPRERKLIDWTYIGILSEQFGNSSPGNCLMEILQEIAKRKNQTGLSFIFFDRLQPGQVVGPDGKRGPNGEEIGLNTVFGENMRSISIKRFI